MEVVVRNISPQRPFMRWPDPTTPGNTTKVTYKGCSTCAAAVTEGRGTAGLGTLAKIGLFGFMGLPDDVRARPSSPEIQASLAASDPELAASIEAERRAVEDTATKRLAWYTGVAWVYAISASISGYVHGYNRNKKSVGWGFAWAAFGLFFPALSVGWSLGQGYRKPRGR